MKASLSVASATFAIFALVSTAQASPFLTSDANSSQAHGQSGKASWYGPGFQGRRTASGEIFNTDAMTAAHRTLPFGTRVRVTSRSTGRSIVVRINDRGPFVRGRIIDLSKASAQAIGIGGLGDVTLSLL